MTDTTKFNNRFMIAGVQMPVPLGKSNVGLMQAEVARTMSLFPGVEMIVFSELCAHGPLFADMAEDPGADEAAFQELASRFGIWLVPGSFFVRRDNEIYNQAIVIAPDGKIVGRYDKLFPFRPFEAGVAGGADFLVFDVPQVGRFGLSICYDIWFPEVMRTLSSMGVEVLLHPVLTGTTDRDAELAIVRATAAMFQCYVVDVNGLEAGGVGLSLVADPAGRVAYQAGQTKEAFPIVLDLGLVRQARASGANGLGQVLKSWRDRRVSFDVYKDGTATDYLAGLGPLQPMARRQFS